VYVISKISNANIKDYSEVGKLKKMKEFESYFALEDMYL
jgi:hypothetical protein